MTASVHGRLSETTTIFRVFCFSRNVEEVNVHPLKMKQNLKRNFTLNEGRIRRAYAMSVD